MGSVFTVALPDIGEGVVEGEIVEWLKNPGDSLAQDEPVVVVMTDKATVELPAPRPGKLLKQYYKAGGMAIRGLPLYDIEIEGIIETKSKKPQKSLPSKVGKKTHEHIPPEEKVGTRKALAIPPVRKLAKEMGIDLNKVQGTGKEGRILIEDLKMHHNSSVKMTHFADDEEIPMKGIQGMMARKMSESKRTIPHFSFYEKADAERLIKLRENLKREAAKEKLELTYMPFFIRALSLTIHQFPQINSSFDSSSHTLIKHHPHNIGIAMSTEKGLIVPVLKNVGIMHFPEIIRSYAALRGLAKEGKLSPGDMRDSTITISNYGVLGGGGLWASPIINIPEAAILAVNKIQKQPAVKDGKVVIKDMLNLSWSFDHRVIDGDLAARVSHHFSSLIQNPAQLL